MSSQQENFVQTMQKAFLSHDQQERQHNLQLIENLISTDPQTYVSLSCESVTNQHIQNASLKQVILSALNQSINLKKNPNKNLWNSLSQEIQMEIRTCAFTNLIDSNEQIRNQSGLLLATFFILNLENLENSQETLNALSQNVNNDDANIQKTAIEVLGFICEQLFENNISNLQENLLEILLTGICTGLQTYGPLTVSGIKALGYSLEFLMPKFQDEQFKTNFLKLILTNFQQSIQNNDEKAIELSLQVLEEMLKQIYDQIQLYHKDIFDTAMQACQMNIPNVITRGQEFFKQMLICEQNKPMGYFQDKYQGFAQYCVQMFEQTNEDIEEEFEGLSIVQSTLSLLKQINLLYGQYILNDLLSYVQNQLQSNQEKQKTVAILLLQSMMTPQTTSNKQLEEYLQKDLLTLINFLGRESEILKYRVSCFLQEASEYYYQLLMYDPNFMKLISRALTVLQNKNNQDENEKVQLNLLSLLESLASMANKKDDRDKLLCYQQNLFDNILKDIHLKSANFIDKGYNMIFVFIEKISSDESTWAHYENFMKIITQIQPQLTQDENELTNIVTNTYTIMCLIQTKLMNRDYFQLKKNQFDMLQQSYQYAQNQLKQTNNNVIPQSIFFMAQNLFLMEQNIGQELAKDFLSDFVGHALENKQYQDLMRVGIESFQLISQKYTEQCLQYVEKVFPYLMTLVETEANTLNEDTIKAIFMTLSDLLLYYPQITSRDIQRMQNLAKNCIMHFGSQLNNQQQNLFAWEMISCILDFLVCIIQSIYVDETININEEPLEKFFLEVFQIYQQICMNFPNDLNPKFVATVLEMIMDFCHKFCKKYPQGNEQLDQTFIQNLITYLQNYKNDMDIQATLDYVNRNKIEFLIQSFQNQQIKKNLQMPKKFGDNDKKKQNKKQKNKDKYKEEQDKKKQKAEQEYWKETDKNILKKQQRAEEKKQKALEKKAKQIEKNQEYQKEQKKLDKISATDKDSKQLIKQLKLEAEQLKLKNDKELQEKYKPKNDIVPIYDKVGDDIDKEFEKFYKLERPLQEDEIRAFSEIQALEQIDQHIDKHPERRVKAAFMRYVEKNLSDLQKTQPGMKLRQYKNILWKEFKKSDENPMNKVSNFDWNTKKNQEEQS